MEGSLMRACTAAFLLCVACQSGTTYVMGGTTADEIRAVLDQPQEGGAALSTGRMIYLLPVGELVNERNKLIGTLKGAEVIRFEDGIPRDVVVVGKAESRVMAFARPQVFEAEYPEGTLHVERAVPTGKAPTHYEVSLIQKRRVVVMEVKVSARLEGAWRALFDAARKAGRLDSRLSTLPAGHDRPLASMGDIGIDLRGIDSE